MTTIHYVTWGGGQGTIGTDLDLGRGSYRRTPAFGIRKAIWDAAFGYVNGFPLSAIAYYAWTRSLSQRRWHRTFFRENPTARFGCGGVVDNRTGRPVMCPICHPGGSHE